MEVEVDHTVSGVQGGIKTTSKQLEIVKQIQSVLDTEMLTITAST